MKVVIFCGGKGTRLREETEYRPKPMVPIGNHPILWHIMKIYASHGYKEFILCLGYKGEVIKDYFRNYLWNTSNVTMTLGQEGGVRFHDHHDEEDWVVTLADTGQETLTGGRLERIQRYLGDDKEFLLTYGDGVGNVDIPASIAQHRKDGKVLTLTAVHPPGRFGELGLDAAGCVREFNEKPQAETGWINGGFFVASTGIFAYLKNADEIPLEVGPMQRMAAEGQLQAYLHPGFWQPMDTYAEFILLNRLWNEGRAPWKKWSK